MKNTPIRIFDTSLALVSEVDAYEQAYFTRSLTGYGAFQIVINYNATHASDFKKNYLVQFGTSIHKIGFIEDIAMDVDENGKGSQKLTISGYEAKGIFARRIVIPAIGNDYYIQDAVQETVLKNTLTDQCGPSAPTARKFSLLTIATDQGRGDNYQLQAFNTALSDHLTTAAEASNPYMGFELYFDETNRKLVFDVIIGKDRRQSQSTNTRMVFSSNYDSLKKATINDQNSGFKNVVYVGGQGDGANKTIVKVTEATEATDLLRREEYLDKSSLQTEAALTNAGSSEINSLAQAVLSIDAQTLVKSQYVYGTDWDLGDIVNIIEYGKSFDAQITEVEEEWENGKYNISVAFGKQALSIASVISSTSNDLDQANTSKGSIGWKDYILDIVFSSSVITYSQQYTQIMADVLRISGAVSSNCTLTLQVPDNSTYVGRKRYKVINNTTGAGLITITTGVSGKSILVLSAGNYYQQTIWVDEEGNVVADKGMDSIYPQTAPISRYDMDGVPEIPDDPAGVTYLQSIWATTDGWNSSNCVVSVSNGKLVITTNDIEQITAAKTVSFTGGKIYRIKILSDLTDVIRFRAVIDSVSTILKDASVSANIETIVDMYIPTGSITGLSFGSVNNPTAPIGTKLQFNWIYIGTGAYSTPLIDNSGNGNNSTSMVGVVPVSGGGLQSNGSNSKIILPTKTLSTAFSFRVKITTGTIGTKTYLGEKAAPSGYSYSLSLYVDASGVLKLDIPTSTTAVSTFSSGKTLSSNTTYDIVIKYSAGVWSCYIDGELVATSSITLSDASSAIYLFYSLLNAAYLLVKWGLNAIRYYEYALSDAEVRGLYNLPTPTKAYSQAQYEVEAPTIRAEYAHSSSATSPANTIIDFSTKIEDTHSAVSTGSAWKFIAPKLGLYLVQLNLYTTGGLSVNVKLYKNGVLVRYLGPTPNTSSIAGCQGCTIRLSIGDYINFQIDGSSTVAADANQTVQITYVGP